MSDEESFVILGSSPMSSMEADGVASSRHSETTASSSSDSNATGSRFSSLKNSQIKDLQNAQEIAQGNLIKTAGELLTMESMCKVIDKEYKEKSIENSNDQRYVKSTVEPQMADPLWRDMPDPNPKKFIKFVKSVDKEISMKNSYDQRYIKSTVEPQMADPIFRRQTPIQLEGKMSSLRLEDCVLKSLEQQQKTGELESQTMENSNAQQERSYISPSKIYINRDVQPEMAEMRKIEKLWSRQTPIQLEDNLLRLEDCALKSPLEQHQKTGVLESQTMKNSQKIKKSEESSSGNETKNTLPTSVESSLAASFIMGEVNADVLKTSVYSQFPSISMEASAEDVLKLQNLVTESMQLKDTIRMANNTMKLFYNNTLQWKDKMKTIEDDYKQQLESCKQEIQHLRKQNEYTEANFKAQVEALEIARQKDRDDMIKEISEKSALVENMRAQIVKLEEQQLASFEFVLKNQDDQQISEFEKFYVSRQEHDKQIKNLERQLSELLAQNLDFKDVEKQYIDELNCLKVNLTAAEELIKKNRNEICELIASGVENQKQIEVLEKSLNDMQTANERQAERITLLEQQNEVHRKDFEMEKESRETSVKEKQQILQDLRLLQRKNQQLIEEHQRMSQNYEKKLRSGESMNSVELAAAAVDALSYVNNPQRPIRVSDALPSPSSAAPSSTPPASMYLCPICNKAFKSLHILQSHVNDCIDRT